MSLTITVTCETCGWLARHDVPTAAALLNDGLTHDLQGVPLCPVCNPPAEQKLAEIIPGPGNAEFYSARSGDGDPIGAA